MPPTRPSRPAPARTTLAIVLAVVALLAGSGLALPAPASAEARICTGYSGCAAGGYSDHGYAGQSQTYWWHMALGHNCTAYAAYRMVRSGMANARPWTGEGDAHRWGHEMAGITDGTPRVGAVAWWDSFAGGHGRLGHVAYVEQVVSPDVIVISQDVYRGDFSWTRLTRGAGGWPSGFIHFNDERLHVRARPRVVGRARVDQRLRVTPGRWDRAVDVDYQWLAGGRAIRGARRATFTPGPHHVRARLRVRVTARSSGFAPVVVTTGSTAPVGRGVLRLRQKARTTGAARVGEVVRLRLPRTTPRAGRTHVRWLLDGRRVRGAHGTRVRLAPDAVGRRLSAQVTASRPGYETRRSTVPVGRVRAGRIEVRTAFRVAGRPEVGQELRAVAGRYTPADARLAYVWFRDGEAMPDARGVTYVVRPEDAGHVVAVVVGITRRGYTGRVTGAVAGLVAGAVPTTATVPTP
ncbi:CHAP domain-containing protein [Nocardioides sp.]|uniref:CHAP domain-containing protein n=1 Tax=Nocardioides sp. TaxID=35761 RepID=UPI0027206737|nr:CHAP domain-containing protein [Nocardioides sp.]MDO9455002.1 CHAP domain-containing protein [Nocardioides sp.]